VSESTRQVVITGVGVVAPGGIGAKSFWELITAGRTATRALTLFDATGFRSRIAAEVDFDAGDAGLSTADAGRLDRVAQFAVTAAREALADSGLDVDAVDPGRIGSVVGSAVGCTTRLEDEYQVVSDGGANWNVDPSRAVPFLYDYLVPSSLAREIAWLTGAEGPAAVISTGCTSGLDAIGHAAQLVAEGVIGGAAEAPISPISVACFDAIKATSANNDDPQHASRPFDDRRDGFVIGEGSAFFVFEEASAARRRGAHIYAEFGGFATRGNAYHMTGLRPDGLEMSRSIDVALRRAGLAPEAIDYVNAHGSGTRQNDRHETAAVKRSLGDHAYRTPMSSIKSMIGHSLGAIGALEVAACALALEHQVVPPTANLEVPDPQCDLDYVPKVARDRKLDAVLSVGSGFGGFQSAVILRRPGGVQ
jgi:act minimal PKS ketosynthase (KS/KS alpha)